MNWLPKPSRKLPRCSLIMAMRFMPWGRCRQPGLRWDRLANGPAQPGGRVAAFAYGKVDFFDPKILLSVLMWAVYLLMVYTRLEAGWRGRRAAMLASVAFVTAIVAWIANYFSGMHRFIAS